MKIKSFLLLLCASIFASCTGKANHTADNDESSTETPKAVVCYFSATGTTKAQAERLAELLGSEIYEIKPYKPYTEADLDWRDSNSRSSVEMNFKSSRPELGGDSLNLNDYEIVFVGYPNWWNTAPRIINTFIESYDLEGKTIVPFMTSGGSSIENSEKDLTETYPNLTFAKGLLMNDVSDEDISAWIMPLGLSIAAGN